VTTSGAAARERFLNPMLPALRRQVLALPQVLKEHHSRDKPYVVFTARKAVCVADALERLGYWQPNADYCSTRALDGDLSVFDGADVLLVEDLATSGRTVAEAVQALKGAGASSVSFFAFAAEGEQDELEVLLDVPFVGPYLEARAGDSVNYAQSLVAAFAGLPEPYNIDWPSYRLARPFARRRFLQAGWEPTNAGRRSQTGATTFVPGPALVKAIATLAPPWLAELFDKAELAKVRVYPIAAYPEPGATRAIVNPVVAIGEMREEEITALGADLSQLLGVGSLGSTPRETYRAIQYLLGEMLATLFLKSGGLETEPLDRTWLEYLFVGQTRERVFEAQSEARAFALDHLCPARPVGPRVRVRIWEDLLAEQEEAVRCDGLLTSIFLERWVNSAEHDLRAQRRRSQDAVERRNLTSALVTLDRALEGGSFAIGELEAQLDRRLGKRVDVASSLRIRISEFLDDAIDRGEVVPDVQLRDGYVGRFFRPGEIIDFQRQLAELTGEMLRWFTAPPERRTLSKDRLQKLLASFFRYLNQRGRLPEYGRPEDLPVGAEPLQRRFLIRGIVMDEVDTGEFVGRTGEDPESVRLLMAHHVIRVGESSGYEVEDRPFEFAEGEDLNATAFGRIVARLLALDEHRRRRVTDDQFAFLVTLADPVDQIFALSADLELAMHTWAKGDVDDLATLRDSDLHQLVFQGLDKAAWVESGAANPLLDEFLQTFAAEKDPLLLASARSVTATFRPTKASSGQEKFVHRLGAWFVGACLYVIAREQLADGERSAEERLALLDERLERPQLRTLLDRLKVSDTARELQTLLVELVEQMRGGTTPDTARLERIAERLRDNLSDEATPLRAKAYEQHAAFLSSPAPRRAVTSCLFLRSGTEGAFGLDGENGLRLAYIDESLQNDHNIAHFNVFFKVTPKFNAERIESVIFNKIAGIGGEALLIDVMPPRFRPYFVRDDTLACDGRFNALIGKIGATDVADRTFLIAHTAGEASKLGNFARNHRIDFVAFELFGAHWELSVIGPFTGQQEQLPISAPAIYQKGAQHVVHNTNITTGHVQGVVGPGGNITNSPMIQVNAEDIPKAKEELDRLLIHLRQMPAEEQSTHSEELEIVVAAQHQLEAGESSKAVALLKSGGHFVADTVRELGLELLARLILPSQS
jgi:hypothetical protein